MGAALFRIRLATWHDLENIQDCARLAYSKYTDRMDRKPAPMVADFETHIKKLHVYIAMKDNTFAGYVVFYREADHLHLSNVAVKPSVAGQGIGRSLIEFVEQSARNQRLKAVELYTNEVMTENLAMYPKLGYIEIDRRHQDGFNRVFFRKCVEAV